MLLVELERRGLIAPPTWLSNNTVYLVTMGSQAYGVANEDSDLDVYGVCVPRKSDVFPHLRGEIPGFGRQIQRFEQYQQHHVVDPDARGGNGTEYDLSIYSIVRFFHLCMENNPNMIDSLFVPVNCILHMSEVGRLIRDNRRLFLHKGAWHKFKGYAFSQISKIDRGHNAEGARKELIARYGYDVKFAYHTVRLLNEVEQIMMEGDLDLQRNAEQLKSIRRGEWSLDQVKEYFNRKERDLETLYTTSPLRHSPDEAAIKSLLVRCLETHYASRLTTDELVTPDRAEAALRQIAEIVRGYAGDNHHAIVGYGRLPV